MYAFGGAKLYARNFTTLAITDKTIRAIPILNYVQSFLDSDRESLS
jgi:hypothetical protein